MPSASRSAIVRSAIVRSAIVLVLAMVLGTAWLGCAPTPAPKTAPDAQPSTDDVAMDESADGSASESVEPGEGTDWYDKLAARESELPLAQSLSFGDSPWSAMVPSESAPTATVDEGVFDFEMSIGAETTASCWLYPQLLDVATLLIEFSKLSLDQVEAIETRNIGRVGADQVDGAPYLALDWVYRYSNPEGQARVGMAKLLAANKAAATLLCLHDEVGFVDTFEQGFASLMVSLSDGKAEDDAVYRREVMIVAIRGQPLGFSRSAMSVDADGDYKIEEWSSLLVPVDLQTLQGTDSYSVEFSTADGQMINAVTVDGEGGELAVDLRLDPSDSGWRVAGTFKGKPLDVSFDGPLSTSLGDTLTIRRLIEDGEIGKVVETSSWDATLDPAGVTINSVELLELSEDGAHLRLTTGPMEFAALADRDGWISEGSLDLAGTSLTIKRAFVDDGFVDDGFVDDGLVDD